jgi:hypothetical protein
MIPLDLLIDASGFGEEANPWEAGHRLIYDHLVTPAKVLISGCGDSGVIEGLHYALEEFRHEYVTALWRYGEGLEAQIDEGLKDARLDAIFASGESVRYDDAVLSEIIWWLDQRWFMAFNKVAWPPGGEVHLPPIYARLDALLKPLYDASGRSEAFATADWNDLEDFVTALPLEAQLTIREEVRPLADEWISRLTGELAGSIDLPPDIADLTRLARPVVEITLNGRWPTPYSRQLSPYNVWTMRLLLAFPGVGYRQGEIDRVVRRSDKRFDVMFADGAVETYDRVVTRYGPGNRGYAVIAQRDPGDAPVIDWLLADERRLVADPDDPSRQRFVDPARTTVIDALAALEKRVWQSEKLDKQQLVGRVSLGREAFPKDGGMYDDPSGWLAGQLRAGRYPRYGTARDIRTAIARR